ncbi:Geranylgeranyl pyrophosphate synthase, chloroplastic [Gracilariopsis chorda]|uniref:Geranylgeranyl pyrophosphate synthase, chloroplastic n=1 Tax=Gracilariopsis chorda TaxID=448386 RepID=A0A2V3IFL6_9FLOR|nr:Geranylgeranyl pyrophosphate synthase, chloroplastic [Gracilariopsis chorda]|eukprot:PXF40851.1 Geranylgeranyl pyrophosphate synthase, chloroplastic [Gracilariopsis chorda]
MHLPAFAPPLPIHPPRRVARKPRARRAPLAVAQRRVSPTPPPTPSATPSPPKPQSQPSLRAFLHANKARVDAELDACLQLTDRRSHTLIQAMRYSLMAGGKRIRPILAIAAYQMFAAPHADLAPVMPAALAVEMIHTMSLIHDDLPSMDNDDVRRGKPTNHKVYGEDIAILAGDALLSYAFEYVARNTHSVDPARVVEVLALLTNSVGPDGLAGGQVMDIQSEGQPDISIDTLTWIHTHKTAALLRVSCACGAILGGASPEDVRRVSDFAVKTGLAFQIADDVLDITQSTEVLGKTAGKDLATDKATYPRLLGLDASRQHAKRLITEAKESLAPYGERSHMLYALADFIIARNN